MVKSSLTPVVAGCGHTYTSYVFHKVRPYCPACIPAVRARIDAENAAKAERINLTMKSKPNYHIRRAVRFGVYERDGWVCQLCLDPVDPDTDHPNPWSASLDHIVCRSWTTEPDHSPANLRLAHLWCNVVRGDERRWTAQDFLPTSAMR